MSKRWKCICGKESPSTVQRCPNCQRPIGMYGTYVTDEQEPVIPVIPPVIPDDDITEQENSKKSTHTPKKKTQKEPIHREPKKKKRRNTSGQAILLLFVLLIIVIMGVLALLLLVYLSGGDSVQDLIPTKPSVVRTMPVDVTMDTQPVDVPVDPTVPVDTQPVQTEPPATCDPDEPHATEPPVEDDPSVKPGSGDPGNPTEPILASDFLKATIHGEEIIFQLNEATVRSDHTIYVSYFAYNPRGELRYHIFLCFNKNLKVGTYNTTGSILHSKVDIGFQDYAIDTSGQVVFRSYRKSGDNGDITGTFVIEKMSDDWMTYDGSFNVELVLYGKKDSIVIDDAVFNFTLR